MSLCQYDIPDSNSQVIDACWYTSRQTIGIVLVRNTLMNEVQAYIGVATDKHDIVVDCIDIAQFGSKVSQQMAEAAFGYPIHNWKKI